MAEINRNTVQKEVVERIVCSSCDHPTAETVYLRAKSELPSISLGTVYRILKKLVADGKILEIGMQNAPSVFDKTLRMHAHFVCDKCGKVWDVDIDEDKFNSAISDGEMHRIDGAQVIFNGACRQCIENEQL